MSVAAVSPPRSRLPVLSPPATRAACAEFQRPCRALACKYNLAVKRLRGRSAVRDGMGWALDYADHGGMTLEEVAGTFGETRERIHQAQFEPPAHLATKLARRGLVLLPAPSPRCHRPIVSRRDFPGRGSQASQESACSVACQPPAWSSGTVRSHDRAGATSHPSPGPNLSQVPENEGAIVATLQTAETKANAERPTAADIEETKAFLDAHQPPSEVERAAARARDLGWTPGSPQASGWIPTADWRLCPFTGLPNRFPCM
jgi:hypothetical protein